MCSFPLSFNRSAFGAFSVPVSAYLLAPPSPIPAPYMPFHKSSSHFVDFPFFSSFIETAYHLTALPPLPHRHPADAQDFVAVQEHANGQRNRCV